MKKYASLLLAGAALAVASCGNNENTTTQEQIDSMAAYRADTMAAALKAQNDSLINAMAQMRADSALRADSIARVMANSKSTSTTTRTTVTQTSTTRPAKTQKQSEQDRKFQEMGGNAGTGVNKQTNDISKEKKQEQDDKFKQMQGR